MEEVQLVIADLKQSMDASLKHLENAFLKIRAGKASPAMLGGVLVDYYGSLTPLSQVANVTAPDGMTLAIQPWEKPLLGEIEKAVFQANLGFTPSNNGENIIISVPPLTEERRKELAKQAKVEVENAKVGIRKARQDANNDLKKIDSLAEDLKKDGEDQIQKQTDAYVKKAEDAYAEKEKEIMKV